MKIDDDKIGMKKAKKKPLPLLVRVVIVVVFFGVGLLLSQAYAATSIAPVPATAAVIKASSLGGGLVNAIISAIGASLLALFGFLKRQSSIAKNKKANKGGVAFLGAPDWSDRYKRAVESFNSDTPALASDTRTDGYLVAPKVAEKGYPVLMSKKNIAKYYAKINDLESSIQKTFNDQADKDRAKLLKGLCNKVLENLQALDDIGQIDNAILVEREDGRNEWSEHSNSDKAEAKLIEIYTALYSMVTDRAAILRNEIESIELPKTDPVKDELDALRFKGSLLLDTIRTTATSVNTESVFVLEKIISERLDEIWQEYKKAKEAYFEKDSDALDLSVLSATMKTDDIIKEVLSDIKAIYKDIDTSIKTSTEASAINNLLITKKYFNNR